MTTNKLVREALHNQVARMLRQEIVATSQPGKKLETETQLAQRFGVSIRTVREALSVLAYEGLVVRRHGSGTYVSDGAPQAHVALLIGTSHPYGSYTYFPLRVVEALNHMLAEKQYPVRTYWANFSETGEVPDPALNDFKDAVAKYCVAGGIMIKGPFDGRWREAIAESRVPMVGSLSPYRVQSDIVKMVEEGVRCLVEAGRKNLALLEFRDPEGPVSVVNARRDAFLRACLRYGIQPRAAWTRGDLHPQLPGAGYEEFKEMWTATPDRPDGLLVCDDYLFQEATLAILEMGIKVPEQLMVVTHANKDSRIPYPFPTVRLEFDPCEFASSTCDLLVRLMNEEPVAAESVQSNFKVLGWPDLEAQPPRIFPAASEALPQSANP